ncbi:hypothetical protein AAMO2058_000934000 [Amorphochlora amoebiformis]
MTPTPTCPVFRGKGLSLTPNGWLQDERMSDIYLRLKREKTTLFLSCNTHEKVNSLIKQVSELVGVETKEILLLKDGEKGEQEGTETPKEELDGDKSIKSHGLQNASIVYYVFKKDDGNGGSQWESVHIV